MSFKCRVVFSGLCSLVPRLNKKGEVDGACFVLVNGQKRKKKDPKPRLEKDLSTEDPLRRHRAFLQFKLGNLNETKDLPADSDGLWYLDRQRIHFEIHSLQSNKWHLDEQSLVAVPRMDKALGAVLGNVNPQVLRRRPPRTVSSQVVLDEGRLFVDPEDAKYRMKFKPKLLDTKNYTLTTASRVTLEYLDLNSFTIVANSIDPLADGSYPPPTRLQLHPNEAVNKGDLLIKIVNFCPEDVLEWYPKSSKDPDKDFRWYYEQYNKKNWKSILKKLDKKLPIPHPVGSSKAGGDNCIPNRYSPLRFDLS